MAEKPKSNKIKKQRLQAKKNKQQAKEKKPVVYSFVKKVRNLRAAVEELFTGAKFPHHSETNIRNIASIIDLKNPNPYLKNILLHLIDQKVEFADKGIPHDRNNTQKIPLVAIANIAKFYKVSIRPIETWKSPSHNTIRCLSSLTRHLYTKYEMPHFMDGVWYFNNQIHIKWFLHIGLGFNIRTADNLPVPLTKKEAHFFMRAPKDFTPLNAIRYGQIVNMGGNEFFVRQILKTRIANDYDVERNKFWYSVFIWLMANPMLDTHHYAPILDYINYQKYIPYAVGEDGTMVPRQPNFSMKNRDPEALLRAVEVWHVQIGKEAKGQFGSWNSSGYKGLNHKSGDTLHIIREICMQTDLIEEGRKMHHCVGSYAWSCHRGDISIWAYETMDKEGLHKQLTLEVNNRDGTIRQARGKYNALPTASEMYFVRMWANEAKLSISRYLI